MNNLIDECFLNNSKSNLCLSNQPEEKLLKMIITLYKLIEEKEDFYMKNKTYNKDDLTNIELYIKNLLRHVMYYRDNIIVKKAAKATAVAERLAAELEKAKIAAEAAEEELEKAKEEVKAEKLAATEAAKIAAAETERLSAAEALAAAEAEAERLAKELEKAKKEAEAALKESRVQLVTSSSQSSSPASSQSSSPASSPASSQSSSPASSQLSSPQLNSTNSTTWVKLSDNTETNKNNYNKFIINLIKILNFGLDTKITNNNTTNTNKNFNEKINNIIQQNNNIIHALYNNNNNTTINFGNENTIVKPLFLTDGFIYDRVNIEINKYYTPLFGIDENNFFKSIPNSGENNNLNNYKLILFMIKFDYIGLNKYYNIYEDNNINSINYLDKRYNTLNNNKFLKITDNIYKINKKYYYDYTSDNIQKHIIEKVVV
jgi:hypothetical protein